jgi:hypothetical protein
METAIKFIKKHCDTTDGLLNPFDAAKAMIEFSRLKCIEKSEKQRVKTLNQVKQIKKQQKSYSLDDLKKAYAMGRTNKTIKDFNETFKKK